LDSLSEASFFRSLSSSDEKRPPRRAYEPEDERSTPDDDPRGDSCCTPEDDDDNDDDPDGEDDNCTPDEDERSELALPIERDRWWPVGTESRMPDELDPSDDDVASGNVTRESLPGARIGGGWRVISSDGWTD
jgi:hypothetical protein